MASTMISTRNPATDGIGLSFTRKLDGSTAKVPEGTIIVSADNHWGLAEDPWKDRVPLRMKDRVPGIWWDQERELWNMGFGGQPIFTGLLAEFMKSSEDRLGVSRIEDRMRDLDAEGIAMELVFPQTLMMFFKHPDLEARAWIFRAYNEYLAEVGSRAPGRYFGVGFINFWDPAKIEESIRHVKDLGLKTFLIPINPGNDADGNPISYASKEMDVLWSAAEEAGLTVYFHVGETSGASPHRCAC